jgi:hypothetical protein
MNLVAPIGAKVVAVDWLNTEILIITSKTKYLKFLQLNRDAPEQFLKAWDENKGYACCVGIDGIPCFIILLRDKTSLVHECVHTAEMILEAKGINSSAKNMFEVRAYMVDYIVRLVSMAIKNKGYTK